MLTGEAAVSAQALSGIFVAGQHLSYKGYHIIVSHTRNGDRSIISVRRGARILIRWSNRDGPINDDSSRGGLVRLLGKRTKQLVIQQSSGGAHCCLHWRVYDLFPKFRLIFDSEPYPIEDAMNDAELTDIDRDGTLERGW
jgi:hypothetical protein